MDLEIRDWKTVENLAPAGEVRVMIVDDHPLVRLGVRYILDRSQDLRLVGEARSVSEAKEVFASLAPDVVVVDVRLPDGDGFELTRYLRQRVPQLGIVVLTMYSGDDRLLSAIDAGASAFVTKNAPAPDLVVAARHAAIRPQAFAARELRETIERVRNYRPTPPSLSGRELEVLSHLNNGKTLSQIAREVAISEAEAKTHVATIYEKLGAGNRAQAVHRARLLGLEM